MLSTFRSAVAAEFTELFGVKLAVIFAAGSEHTGHDLYDYICLLYTSDAADDQLRVNLGGRRLIKKKIYSDSQ